MPIGGGLSVVSNARFENADGAPAAVAPTIGMPDSAVTALYPGETALRMTSVISARQAVTVLAPR